MGKRHERQFTEDIKMALKHEKKKKSSNILIIKEIQTKTTQIPFLNYKIEKI